MELNERQEYQEEGSTRNDFGTTLMTIGAIFLLADIAILLFVGRDVREGSKFFVVWELAQGALGVICIIIGFTKKLRAHQKDDA